MGAPVVVLFALLLLVSPILPREGQSCWAASSLSLPTDEGQARRALSVFDISDGDPCQPVSQPRLLSAAVGDIRTAPDANPTPVGGSGGVEQYAPHASDAAAAAGPTTPQVPSAASHSLVLGSASHRGTGLVTLLDALLDRPSTHHHPPNMVQEHEDGNASGTPPPAHAPAYQSSGGSYWSGQGRREQSPPAYMSPCGRYPPIPVYTVPPPPPPPAPPCYAPTGGHMLPPPYPLAALPPPYYHLPPLLQPPQPPPPPSPAPSPPGDHAHAPAVPVLPPPYALHALAPPPRRPFPDPPPHYRFQPPHYPGMDNNNSGGGGGGGRAPDRAPLPPDGTDGRRQPPPPQHSASNSDPPPPQGCASGPDCTAAAAPQQPPTPSAPTAAGRRPPPTPLPLSGRPLPPGQPQDGYSSPPRAPGVGPGSGDPQPPSPVPRRPRPPGSTPWPQPAVDPSPGSQQPPPSPPSTQQQPVSPQPPLPPLLPPLLPGTDPQRPGPPPSAASPSPLGGAQPPPSPGPPPTSIPHGSPPGPLVPASAPPASTSPPPAARAPPTPARPPSPGPPPFPPPTPPRPPPGPPRDGCGQCEDCLRLMQEVVLSRSAEVFMATCLTFYSPLRCNPVAAYILAADVEAAAASTGGTAGRAGLLCALMGPCDAAVGCDSLAVTKLDGAGRAGGISGAEGGGGGVGAGSGPFLRGPLDLCTAEGVAGGSDTALPSAAPWPGSCLSQAQCGAGQVCLVPFGDGIDEGSAGGGAQEGQESGSPPGAQVCSCVAGRDVCFPLGTCTSYCDLPATASDLRQLNAGAAVCTPADNSTGAGSGSSNGSATHTTTNNTNATATGTGCGPDEVCVRMSGCQVWSCDPESQSLVSSPCSGRCRPRVPRAARATVANDGASVSVRLNAFATRLALVPCGGVFDTVTTELLGGGTAVLCSTTEDILTVRLPATARIRVGQRLVFPTSPPSALVTQVDPSAAFTGSVTLLPCTDCASPVASLTGPAALSRGPCDGSTDSLLQPTAAVPPAFDASQSRDPSGRTAWADVRWSTSTSATGAFGAASITAATAAATGRAALTAAVRRTNNATNPNDRLVLSLTAAEVEMMSAAAWGPYTLTVTVTSWLGTSASEAITFLPSAPLPPSSFAAAASENLSSMDDSVGAAGSSWSFRGPPAVRVQGPSAQALQLRGPSGLLGLSVGAEADLPCGLAAGSGSSDGGLSLDWLWSSSWFGLPAAGRAGQTLFLQAPLPAAHGMTLTLSLNASYGGQGSSTSTSSRLVLTALGTAPSARLTGPAGDVAVSSPSARLLVFNATASTDPDSTPQLQQLRFKWDCRREDYPNPCFTGPDQGDSLSSPGVWTLPAASLSPGKLHTVTVTVSKPVRAGAPPLRAAASLSFRLRTGAEAFPTGTLTRQCSPAECDLPHRTELPLTVKLEMDAEFNNAAVSWSSPSVPSVASLSAASADTDPNLRRGTYLLTLPPASLPRNLPTITLTAKLTSPSTSLSGSAVLTVPLNSAPSCSQRASDPSACLKVVLVNDTFPTAVVSVRAQGWTDDQDSQLTYEFGLRVGVGGDTAGTGPALDLPQQLGALSSAALVGLPEGNVTVYGCAIDGGGGRTCGTAAVVVKPPPTGFNAATLLGGIDVQAIRKVTDVRLLLVASWQIAALLPYVRASDSHSTTAKTSSVVGGSSSSSSSAKEDTSWGNGGSSESAEKAHGRMARSTAILAATTSTEGGGPGGAAMAPAPSASRVSSAAAAAAATAVTVSTVATGGPVVSSLADELIDSVLAAFNLQDPFQAKLALASITNTVKSANGLLTQTAKDKLLGTAENITKTLQDNTVTFTTTIAGQLATLLGGAVPAASAGAAKAQIWLQSVTAVASGQLAAELAKQTVPGGLSITGTADGIALAAAATGLVCGTPGVPAACATAETEPVATDVGWEASSAAAGNSTDSGGSRGVSGSRLPNTTSTIIASRAQAFVTFPSNATTGHRLVLSYMPLAATAIRTVLGNDSSGDGGSGSGSGGLPTSIILRSGLFTVAWSNPVSSSSSTTTTTTTSTASSRPPSLDGNTSYLLIRIPAPAYNPAKVGTCAALDLPTNTLSGDLPDLPNKGPAPATFLFHSTVTGRVTCRTSAPGSYVVVQGPQDAWPPPPSPPARNRPAPPGGMSRDNSGSGTGGAGVGGALTGTVAAAVAVGVVVTAVMVALVVIVARRRRRQRQAQREEAEAEAARGVGVVSSEAVRADTERVGRRNEDAVVPFSSDAGGAAGLAAAVQSTPGGPGANGDRDRGWSSRTVSGRHNNPARVLAPSPRSVARVLPLPLSTSASSSSFTSSATASRPDRTSPASSSDMAAATAAGTGEPGCASAWASPRCLAPAPNKRRPGTDASESPGAAAGGLEVEKDDAVNPFGKDPGMGQFVQIQDSSVSMVSGTMAAALSRQASLQQQSSLAASAAAPAATQPAIHHAPVLAPLSGAPGATALPGSVHATDDTLSSTLADAGVGLEEVAGGTAPSRAAMDNAIGGRALSPPIQSLSLRAAATLGNDGAAGIDDSDRPPPIRPPVGGECVVEVDSVERERVAAQEGAAVAATAGDGAVVVGTATPALPAVVAAAIAAVAIAATALDAAEQGLVVAAEPGAAGALVVGGTGDCDHAAMSAGGSAVGPSSKEDAGGAALRPCPAPLLLPLPGAGEVVDGPAASPLAATAPLPPGSPPAATEAATQAATGAVVPPGEALSEVTCDEEAARVAVLLQAAPAIT